MEAVQERAPATAAGRDMARAFELDLGDRLLQLATDGIPPASAPSARLATDAYTSPERLQDERRLIARRPAAALASSEIATPTSRRSSTIWPRSTASSPPRRSALGRFVHQQRDRSYGQQTR